MDDTTCIHHLDCFATPPDTLAMTTVERRSVATLWRRTEREKQVLPPLALARVDAQALAFGRVFDLE